MATPFLSTIRGRPGQFLGDEDVNTLATYMSGYVQAREDLGVPPYGEEESALLSEFDDWLVDHLELNKVSASPGYGWPKYIKDLDASTKSVRTFFRLFEQFLVAKGKSFLRPDDSMSKWPAHPWPIGG